MTTKRISMPQAYPRKIIVRPGATRMASKALIFLTGFLFVTTLCSILYLNQASQVDALRQEIRAKQAECAELRRQNALQRERIARLGRLATLEKWEKQLGFVEIGTPQYVVFNCLLPTASSDQEDQIGPRARETTIKIKQTSNRMNALQRQGKVDKLSLWIRGLLSQFEDWLSRDSVTAGGR